MLTDSRTPCTSGIAHPCNTSYPELGKLLEKMQQEAQRSGSSMKYMNTVRLCINSIILLTSSASSCHKNTNAAATALAASVALNVRLAVLAVVHNTRLMQLLLLLQIKNPDQTKER